MVDKISKEKIQSLKKNILTMARYIQEILNKLEVAVIEKNSTMNHIVLFSEDIINDYYNNIFKEYNGIYSIIDARGKSLRLLAMTNHLINVLHQIGLSLVEISKANKFLININTPFFNEQLKLSFKTLKAMIRETIDNFISFSYEKSNKICKMENFLQKIIDNLEFEIIDFIKESGESCDKILKVYNIFKAINQIGNNIIKINETSFYIENAKIYKCTNGTLDEKM
jgi:phosphate uptake regulator